MNPRYKFPLLTSLTISILASAQAFAGSNALVDTTNSPHAKMYMVDMEDVHWTGGLWGERFEVLKNSMIPYMWELFQSEEDSHAWANFLVAAGMDDGLDGKHHGPPFNDGDFLKWFEGLANVYAITKDPEIDALMDRIIHVVGKAQREDGYLHTQNIIPERKGDSDATQFQDRYHFETYNMGHLMTAACVHHRVTGKSNMLKLAEKAADYLYNFYESSSPELARNAICPSHYMGVVELYRLTGKEKYRKLSKELIEIRDLVEDGTDHNQDRIPFREMEEAVGHAVRANYLYAGVADVFAESGDTSLFNTLDTIASDVADQKLYITGMTGALYDGASPFGTFEHEEMETVHQAYGHDYQLPNKTAYNESCANIGYALWNWRMLLLTGNSHYADLMEQTLYNGVLPAISLEGTKYFYVNPLQKVEGLPIDLRWSRTRQPNIQYSFCCPPNVVRTIAQVQNYAYTLSPDSLWVHLYNDSKLQTQWQNGDKISLEQTTDYPWDGLVNFRIDNAPDSPFALKLRIPGWVQEGTLNLSVNGESIEKELVPGTYASIVRKWKAGDEISFQMKLEPTLWKANPMVEETRNQVAMKYGPIVYCLESNDIPEDVDILDVALSPTDSDFEYNPQMETIDNANVLSFKMPAIVTNDEPWNSKDLYRPANLKPPRKIDTKWIPYYAWGNRGDHEMTVWIPLR